MIVLGTVYSLEGKTYGQIGELLRELSPKKDGVGLEVCLTDLEIAVFAEGSGRTIGYTLCQLLAEAIREAGGNPNGFKYKYTDQVFTTTASAPTA